MGTTAYINGKPQTNVWEDFNTSVSLGFNSAYSFERKFAECSDIDLIDGFVDIWNFRDVDSYTYSTTADIDTISSDNAGDTQDILIYGLDANYAEVTQIVTLTGQTKATLATPLLRVWRMQNLDSTTLAGDVFLYPDTAITTGKPDDASTVRGYISTGDNQTLMSQYTVPAGKSMLVKIVDTSYAKAQSATSVVRGFVKPFGGVPLLTTQYSVSSTGSSQHWQEAPAPFIVPAKADIIFEANSSANDGGVTLSYQFILVSDAYVATRKGL